MSVNAVSFYQCYLTGQEQNVCKQLDERLQGLVIQRLLCSSESVDIDFARFIFKVIRKNKNMEEKITNFFLCTLPTTNIALSLEKFTALDHEEKISHFFQLAALRVWDNAETAIERFEDFLRGPDVAEPILRELPVSLRDILDCHYSFIDMLCLVKEYLSSLPVSQRLPLSTYEPAFQFLENDVTFREEEKLTLIKMIVVSTSGEFALQGYSQGDLQEFIIEANKIVREYGNEFFNAFCMTNVHSPISLDEAIRIAKLVNANIPGIFGILEAFVQEYAHDNYVDARQGLITRLEDAIPDVCFDAINREKEIGPILERFSEMPFPLKPEQLDQIARQYQIIQGFCEENYRLRMGALVLQVSAICMKPELNENDVLHLIAIARLALRIKFCIYLHHTQILTVLGQLLFPDGCIAQVKTGEGKSMIVTTLGFVFALQKKNMYENSNHIISSSPSLVIRDQKKYEEFFMTFGITTSSICDQPDAKRFWAHILYGTASDFEFAIMREMLYRTPLFLQPYQASSFKRFDHVIVDEVDNLTIDTAANSARLAHAAEVTYEWIYAPIFKFIKNHGRKEQDGFLQDDIERLKAFLSNDVGPKFNSLANSILDENFREWLVSAHKAFFKLTEDKDYVIKNNKVLIVDATNTGRIMIGSRWSNGVHEFVELKHGLPVQQESLIPISLSHPVYYPMYKGVFGLTGTMGAQSEREEVSEIYNVQSFDVPTYHIPKREDKPLVICRNDEEHLERIVEEIRMCRAMNRPILVLCETIQETKTIQDKLMSLHISHEILNEMQEKTEEEVLEKAGYPRAVTVATNTAGRGTDILLNEDSRKNGGLYVLLTSFPASLRVEQQARGRAGRQEDPGSSAMFVSASSLGIKEEDIRDAEKVLAELYQKRKKSAELMKHVHVHHAKIERFRFSLARQFFQKMSTFHEGLTANLPRLSRDLVARRLLNAVQPDFTALNVKDALIAQNAFDLLTSRTTNTDTSVSWCTLLQQIVQRIHNLMINDWSVNFYQHTENLIEHSAIAQYSVIQELFKQINPAVALDLEAAMEHVVNILQNEFNEEFRTKLDQWDVYLTPSGDGVLRYLYEIKAGHSPL
ncbi:MAG: hypothetical protein P4L16_06370 [Chlamydiales bacterium]|nr:hypothetical protein [Chlamydiales bacterium]